MSSALRSKKIIIPAAVLAVGGVGVGAAALTMQEGVAAETVLDCGTFNFPKCSNSDKQFDDSFVESAPAVTERAVGGFGGQADCTPERTPVVFVHGNADRATNWDSDITGPVGDRPVAPLSVYDEFRAAGYSGCELFGLTYLSEADQKVPQDNYHEPDGYAEILDFVDAVRDYTGSEQVNIVSHSFGVSMSMAAMTWDAETRGGDGWHRVERFVNIAGGLRGLGSCRVVGYANPIAKTCGSQNVFGEYVFGFHPDGAGYANNDWTGAEGPRSLRSMPALHPEVAFYTISAGAYDQVHCTPNDRFEDCAQGALFEPSDNVRAQIDVGTGTPAAHIDNDLADGAIFNMAAGDLDGVGHFKAKNNTGRILVEMLGTECRQAECTATYESGPAVPVAPL
ncbi:hypothetical protein [Granulicoccus sp. GXG6511]|uniref:hypothetical protein n=1 Tax=Granulicoccus sp. GXG6511 TaxID=3381351 RepID=UPI003D7DDBD3